jgi:nitrogen fixation NifU-like protein
MLYSEKVMQMFRDTKHYGKIENADGLGKVGNPRCGDVMWIYIKVDNGIVTDAKFETFGCVAAIATSSMAIELVKGKPVDEALRLTNKAVAEALDGLPPEKMHCSLLAEEGIKAAIEDYQSRQKHVA